MSDAELPKEKFVQVDDDAWLRFSEVIAVMKEKTDAWHVIMKRATVPIPVDSKYVAGLMASLGIPWDSTVGRPLY